MLCGLKPSHVDPTPIITFAQDGPPPNHHFLCIILQHIPDRICTMQTSRPAEPPIFHSFQPADAEIYLAHHLLFFSQPHSPRKETSCISKPSH